MGKITKIKLKTTKLPIIFILDDPVKFSCPKTQQLFYYRTRECKTNVKCE